MLTLFGLRLTCVFSLSFGQVMVIIKKDEYDYVTFTNSSRVYKMSVTPANDNVSTFLSGNGGVSNDNATLTMPPNNNNQNNNNNTITMTIRRDSSQQQLEKLQQYTQQQNQLMQQQQQQNQQLAKAQLNCRPNSHPFPVSWLLGVVNLSF